MNLGGNYSSFISDVGIDNEVGENGSVSFQVYGDSVLLYDSGVMFGNSATQTINVSVAGRNELKLVVNNGGDNINYDHADWAGARVLLRNDPAVVGQWCNASSWPIVAIHTHLLPNGKVLVWGRDDSTLTMQTYIWDPDSQTFPAQILNETTNLFCSGHAFLPDGRLLVTGGHHFDDGHGEPHTNIFDYTNNTWARVSDMNAGRWYPTTTALANGELLVVSGTDINGEFNSLPQVWQTNIGGGWRSLTSAAGQDQALYPWMLLAPNGKVFNSGPNQPTRYLDTAGGGSWSFVGNSLFGFRDYGSSVMYNNGKVMITGGGPPTNTTEVIDLNQASPVWRSVGAMSYSRRQMNTLILPDGKVLATGGTSGSGFNNALGSVYPAEMWDPVSEKWSPMASMKVKRLYHSTTVLLPDGRALSAGGGQPAGGAGDTNHRDMEIYMPPYLFKGRRPTISSAPTSVSYGQTFFIGTPNGTSISNVNWVRLSSVTHAFNENQRINRLSFAQSLDQTGLLVTAPTNRNLCPPGHYMLFILNANGVPSVAKIIQIT